MAEIELSISQMPPPSRFDTLHKAVVQLVELLDDPDIVVDSTEAFLERAKILARKIADIADCVTIADFNEDYAEIDLAEVEAMTKELRTKENRTGRVSE